MEVVHTTNIVFFSIYSSPFGIWQSHKRPMWFWVVDAESQWCVFQPNHCDSVCCCVKDQDLRTRTKNLNRVSHIFMYHLWPWPASPFTELFRAKDLHSHYFRNTPITKWYFHIGFRKLDNNMTYCRHCNVELAPFNLNMMFILKGRIIY